MIVLAGTDKHKWEFKADLAAKQPAFALEAGMLALRWLAQGYGYEITSADVWAAYSNTLKAAEKKDVVTQTKQRIRELVASEVAGGFVARILGRELPPAV